jgi:hypothetical protein
MHHTGEGCQNQDGSEQTPSHRQFNYSREEGGEEKEEGRRKKEEGRGEREEAEVFLPSSLFPLPCQVTIL